MAITTLANPGPAAGAPVEPAFMTAREPIHIRVVRSSDPLCSRERCSDWLALEGPIGPGSAARFARVVQGLVGKRLPVLISSPGGLVNEAMAMGRLIRSKNLDVGVTRTAYVSCPGDREACSTTTPDGVVLGLPDSRRAFCASACTLVLAAGTRRLVSPWARVGVHQYVGFIRKMTFRQLFRITTRMVDGRKVEVSRTLIARQPVPDSAVTVRGQPHYGESVAYFSRMGIADGIMALIRSAPSTSIYWMTPEDLLATRMATDDIGGEALVTHDGPLPQAAMPKSLSPKPSAGADPSHAPAALETAVLIDDAGTRVRLVSGHATWSVEREIGQGRDAGGADLVANVDLDDDAGSLTFRVSKRYDAAGRLSTHLFVRMLHGSNSPFHHILAVEAPGLRKDAHALPDPVVGQVEDASPAAFSMVLSDTAQDALRDMALLTSGRWIDVPIMIEDARTVKMTFALGSSGSLMVRQWQAMRVVHSAR